VPEAVPDVVASIDDAGAGGADAAHSVTRDKGDDAAKAKKGNKVNKKAIGELSVGQELVGKVKTVASYGAFVDLGYASDGLVHISRIADDFVSNVEDHLKAGQEVTVRVISIDLEKKQVALTMRSEEAEANADSDATARKEKRSKKPRRSGGDRAAQAASATALARSSWDTEKFIEGEVASVLDFGAFVRFDSSLCGEGLSGELDGLVHISALRKERVEDVSSIVSVGDKVQIRVKSVDEESGKVSLSMVSKEDEPAPRKGGGGGGGGDKKDRGPRLDDIFAAETMGAADWSDSMGKFEQPSFTNNVIIKGQ
jgi:predicted RNA-binding protein with RPS1 domain